VKPKVAVRVNPDFPVPRKTNKKNKRTAKKSASKILAAELGKQVEKCDLLNNLA